MLSAQCRCLVSCTMSSSVSSSWTPSELTELSREENFGSCPSSRVSSSEPQQLQQKPTLESMCSKMQSRTRARTTSTAFSTLLVTLILLAIAIPGDGVSADDIEKVYVRRGANGTLPCLPAEQAARIQGLEWYKEDRKLVEIKEERMTVWAAEAHVSFLPETGALYFRSVAFSDSGEYRCVVNGDRERTGVVRFFVQDPSAPINLSLARVSDSLLKLTWEEPEHTAGDIQGYHVYILNVLTNYTKVKKVTHTQRNMEFTVNNLRPFTSYRIWVKPFTWKHEGSPSRIIDVRTDVLGPTAPYIVNLTCSSLDSLFMQWERPATFYNQIDYYFVYYRPEDSLEFKEIALSARRDRIDHEILITNLTSNTLYEVKVQGASRSIIDHSRIYRGEFSEPRKLALQMPSAPLNLSLAFVGDSMVKLKWEEPEHPNGHIQGYHVYILNVNSNYTKVQKVIHTQRNMEFTVNNLRPFTSYKMWVKPFTWKHEGSPSRTIEMRTDVQGPTAPYIVNLTCSSLDSLFLGWERPATFYSQIDYYFVYYRSEDSLEFKEISVKAEKDHIDHDILIANLTTNTLYEVKVQGASRSIVDSSRIYRGEFSEPRKVALQSTCEMPSAPLNLSLARVGDSLVKLKWEEPEHPNGHIQGYHVYILNVMTNYTEVKKVIHTQRSMEFTVNNLRPFTTYKVWVKAFTWKHEGSPSRTIEMRTDVQGPTAPYIVNLTCSSLDSLFLQWERPATYYNQIDYYFVYYRSEDSWEFEEIALSAGRNRIDHEILIANLTADTLYEVKVQGASRSIVENSRIYRGEFSEPRKVVLQSKCESYVSSPYIDSTISASMVAGVVCASFALFLAILSFVLWRKYFQAAYYYLDDPPSQTRGSSPQLTETYDDSEYSSVPVSLWSKHVQDLHADGDIGFSREYEAIQTSVDMDLSCVHSQMAENKNKNRYVNIVAYDHSRVVLKTLPDQKKNTGSDYINGNFIDGYNKPRAYIGTQGPLPSTFEDYWRMIWEQRICIIVMITNLVERGRHHSLIIPQVDDRKCDLYWPKEGTESYGPIQVTLLQEVVMATYILRTFTMRNTKVKKKHGCERTVYQYHYTNWPDHGVPDHPLPVLSFVRKSSAANPPTAGPIIVHCSAGVGRTGTYIVIDAMLKQIKHRQSLNAFGFLKHIRQQRNYLVQTEEQYIFTHDALLEAIESGDTEVPSSHLCRYIQTLQTGGDGVSNASSTFDIKMSDSLTHSLKTVMHWPLLEKQYKLATCFRAKDFNVVSALKPANKGKNRSLNLIPLEAQRVHITPRAPGTDGSDYINATFFPGFNQLKEFIVTQHPVHETIADFWQMAWDHNATTIVVLSSVIDEKEFSQFWPEKDAECDYGSFKVKLTEETTMYQELGGCITTRNFIIQSTQDDYELTCRLIHCPGWPESCGPLSSVFDLIKLVQDWHLDQTGPVIVMDRYGGTEAATFCSLTTLYKQLNFEDSVDVYMYSKLYHLRRPGIWRTKDDYLFLYRAMESLVEQMSLNDPADGGSPFGSQLTVTNNVNLSSNGHALKIVIPGEIVKNESFA